MPYWNNKRKEQKGRLAYGREDSSDQKSEKQQATHSRLDLMICVHDITSAPIHLTARRFSYHFHVPPDIFFLYGVANFVIEWISSMLLDHTEYPNKLSYLHLFIYLSHTLSPMERNEVTARKDIIF